MTSSGTMLSSASRPAVALLKGWTSCPSERRSSETIWSIVISSSTSRTLAMCATVVAFPYGSKFVFSWFNRNLFARRIDDFAHLEDGQKHTNYNTAHHDTEE